jgi:hypothetical protein
MSTQFSGGVLPIVAVAIVVGIIIPLSPRGIK